MSLTEDAVRATAEPNHRPFSNGTEYDIWAARWCFDCRRDDPDTERYCPILTVAVGDQAWPMEWTRRTIGEPPASYQAVDECTEFERRDDDGGDDDPDDTPPPPPPAVEIDGQTDILSVFVDQITEQARPAEVLR